MFTTRISRVRELSRQFVNWSRNVFLDPRIHWNVVNISVSIHFNLPVNIYHFNDDMHTKFKRHK